MSEARPAWLVHKDMVWEKDGDREESVGRDIVGNFE